MSLPDDLVSLPISKLHSQLVCPVQWQKDGCSSSMSFLSSSVPVRKGTPRLMEPVRALRVILMRPV